MKTARSSHCIINRRDIFHLASGGVAGWALKRTLDYLSLPQELIIIADSNSECYIEGTAGFKNGYFPFILDSRASGVFFGAQHLPLLGLDANQLTYNAVSRSAVSKTRIATIRLPEIRFQNFVLTDVDAYIYEQNTLYPPALGAPVLKKLNFQMRESYCVLTLPPQDVKRPDKLPSISMRGSLVPGQ